ncbi:hypothetical protein C8R45DRAFT_1137289 [Mycena sanguinolenta]|nr:hypothetical protein C8R45DRAFT_1137289 [Mycena sanguinolenta]
MCLRNKFEEELVRSCTSGIEERWPCGYSGTMRWQERDNGKVASAGAVVHRRVARRGRQRNEGRVAANDWTFLTFLTFLTCVAGAKLATVIRDKNERARKNVERAKRVAAAGQDGGKSERVEISFTPGVCLDLDLSLIFSGPKDGLQSPSWYLEFEVKSQRLNNISIIEILHSSKSNLKKKHGVFDQASERIESTVYNSKSWALSLNTRIGAGKKQQSASPRLREARLRFENTRCALSVQHVCCNASIIRAARYEAPKGFCGQFAYQEHLQASTSNIKVPVWVSVSRGGREPEQKERDTKAV